MRPATRDRVTRRDSVTVTEPFSKRDQPEKSPSGHTYTDSVVHRKVSTKGSGGVTAKVIVIARRGYIWMSIEPPFTWEAIMEPEKVDELMHTLGLAREDAKKMAAARGRRGKTQ